MGKKKIRALLKSLQWHHDVAMRASSMETGWGRGTVTSRLAAAKKHRHMGIMERKICEALRQLDD